ncbi:hypothetical protein AAKU52_000552 [Pedobacter sp. CG_S7]|uniref:hypothetical protein n=1 Tax=Pedobacter sp. CG_S7 TaxID=3143930 RepID=UPI003393F6D7
MVNKERISILLAKPYQVEMQDISLLEDLSSKFPFFEPLHLLLAKANPTKASALTAASLHSNGALLHKILQQTERATALEFDISEHHLESTTKVVLEPVDEAAFEANTQVANLQTNVFETELPQTASSSENFSSNIASTEDAFLLEENFATEEIREYVKGPLKEETKEEIPDKIENPEKERENPVSVSNYDDDTLPYSFLWWLKKTRKEHQAIFQPYVTVRNNESGELQQQYVEHIFHIQSPFNAEEVINNTPQGKHVDAKETEIVNGFLKRAPQISPPKPEQIDNENKAKKSAEDRNDVVSETLAKIYIEQMLYHKAIETYHKLSLKFPEKSRYFADLIQSLEKKI